MVERRRTGTRSPSATPRHAADAAPAPEARRRCALAVLGLALATPGPAAAAPELAVGIADDARPAVRARATPAALATVAAWRGQRRRHRAHRRRVAEGLARGDGARGAPAGFDARRPATTRATAGRAWTAPSRLVRRASACGSSLVGHRARARCGRPPTRPRGSPRATRAPTCSAASRAPWRPATAHVVDRYMIWNEPNVAAVAAAAVHVPYGRRRPCTPVAPHLYRALVRAATPAIRAADPGRAVWFGALAPRGYRPLSRNAPMRPLAFLRALGLPSTCGCSRCARRAARGFRPVAADGLAYHAHGVGVAPDEPAAQPDEAALGDLRSPGAPARRAAAPRRAARRAAGAPVRRPPHRARLGDRPARPAPRDRAGAAGPLAAAERVHRLARPARAHAACSTSGATSRSAGAAPAHRRTRPGSRGCASPTTAPSRRSPPSPSRSGSTPPAAASRGAVLGPGAAGRRARRVAAGPVGPGAALDPPGARAHRRARLLDAAPRRRAARRSTASPGRRRPAGPGAPAWGAARRSPSCRRAASGPAASARRRAAATAARAARWIASTAVSSSCSPSRQPASARSTAATASSAPARARQGVAQALLAEAVRRALGVEHAVRVEHEHVAGLDGRRDRAPAPSRERAEQRPEAADRPRRAPRGRAAAAGGRRRRRRRAPRPSLLGRTRARDGAQRDARRARAARG